MTYQSAGYVTRYVTKKVTGPAAVRHYQRVDGETGEVVEVHPEYATMSRRPGIGATWFARFGEEVYPSDGVVVGGGLAKPPRYYDQLADAELLEEVKAARRAARDRREETWERLAVRCRVVEGKLATLKRRELS